MQKRIIEVLLVDDDPGDVDLILEVLQDTSMALRPHIVHDGVEAMAFLRREGPYRGAVRPDLILLDLNMPRKDGHEVLQDIKQDPLLHTILVVVLTTSASPTDIDTAYRLGANCYVTKPVGLEQFTDMIRRFQDFWLTIVQYPSRSVL
jgi:chemotaxis family two-component system response regulator Rcp1